MNQTTSNNLKNEYLQGKEQPSNQNGENKNIYENQSDSKFSNYQSQQTSFIGKSDYQTSTNYTNFSVCGVVQQKNQSNPCCNPQFQYSDTKNQNDRFQNNNNTFNSTLQHQQLQIPYQKQIEQQIQYYVYEDLNNFMGVLTDVLETLEYFKNQPYHSYIPIAINRLVNQTNISNGVHFSCCQQYQDSEQAKIYLREKQAAETIIQEKINLTSKQTKLKECLDYFEKNFNKTVYLNQIKDVQTEIKGDFNQQVVDQIVSGIQNQEDTRHLIYEGKYKKLEKADIEKNIKYRKERAQELLKANFQKY